LGIFLIVKDFKICLDDSCLVLVTSQHYHKLGSIDPKPFAKQGVQVEKNQKNSIMKAYRLYHLPDLKSLAKDFFSKGFGK